MNILESFKIALRALNANKARAALTMLGVIIGVSSVILLVSIGSGVRQDVVGQMEGLGTNLIFTIPGNYEEMMSGGGGMTASSSPAAVSKKFNIDDVRKVQSKVKGATVVPMLEGGARAAAGNKEMSVSLMSTDGNATDVLTNKLVDGRYYNQSETLGAARVVAIGSDVKKQLFPSRDPIGQEIKINGQRFKVIGLAEAQGGGMGGSQDAMVMMPYTTAQKILGSQDLSGILTKADNPDEIVQIQNQIRNALRPTWGADFSVFTQDQMLGILGTLLGTMTYMLAGIAGISLLVGGIGIMNIMLVSVTERTREIGIRKAVGARTYDILTQFVIESIVLSVLGGLIGITLGAGGAWALSGLLPTLITPWSVGIAFFFSAGVGVFFGVYPAWKASKLDPIEALRHE